MLTFIIRRLLLSIPVFVVATFLMFVGVSLSANPLAQLRMNPRITQEEIATIAHAKRLDKPVVVRYGYWVKDALFHKFGVGLTNPQPICPTLKRVLGHTLQLLVIVLIITVVVGVAIGIYSAVRQYSVFDYTATTLSFIGFAMPVFFAALILQVIFTDIYLHW